MIKNYLKIAVRNLLKNKLHSLINITGLAVGLAACILISLYVINEESYDSFNKNADRIVRATMTFSIGGKTRNVAVTGTKVLPAFKRNFPEVENGVRLYSIKTIVSYKNKVFEEPNFAFADSAFFKVFSFKLIEGNPEQVLSKPYDVILTSSAAKKYFGSKNAIGKIIRINTRGKSGINEGNYTVTGIVQGCPSNSQIKFNFLASFSSLPAAKPERETWFNANYFTYLLLKSPESINLLRTKTYSYMKTQSKKLGLSGSNYITVNLEPLKTVHLHSEAEGGLEPSGDYRYVVIFSLIALLILGIAFANYINITTAKASERACEVGVRKVIGAYKAQLFYQFAAESFIIVIISFFIGLLLVEFALPVFKELYGFNLVLSSLISFKTAAVIGLVILLITILGAGYPAFILSRFQPIKVLKGNYKNGSSGVWLRKSLIILQFVISVGLIICTIIISEQLNYIHNKKLGFDKNHITVLPVDGTMKGKINTLKNELLKNSNIKGVTFTTRTPVFINSTNGIVYDNKKIMINQLGVDQDFLKTLGIKLVAGNNFTKADTMVNSHDKSKAGLPILLNETAVKQLNLTPEKAIGQTVLYEGRNIIKGVVKDFHFDSMHKRISPLLLFLNGYLNKMMVKISGNNISETTKYMKNKWDELFPDHPFQMTFLNDDFNMLYKSEARTKKIFYIFGALAIVLAYMGLFGLISYSVQQRTKEIGIRKTLGAGTGNIITLFSKEYIKLIVLANVIAWPLAWYTAHKWLEGFAYRIEISAWMFLVVMVFTFTFVIIMIGLQSVKTATANPVESLRYE